MTPDDRWLAAVGHLFAASCRRRRRPCWRSAAGRWAASSRCCWTAATRPSASTRKLRKGPTTGGWSSSYAPPWPVESVVASLSLHHVADLDEVLDRLGALLVPGGTLVVVEWAWEGFDEPTARWCSTVWPRRPRERARLAAQAPGAVDSLRPALGRVPPILGRTGGPAPRRQDRAGTGCALHPPRPCRGPQLFR